MKATAKGVIISHVKKEVYANAGEVLEVISTRHAPIYIVENTRGVRFATHKDKILINK